MAIIAVYKNNPTAGTTDGVAVSEGGTFVAPVQFNLNVLRNTEEIQKLAVRTEPGYTTAGTTTISDSGDTADRIQLSWVQDGEYSDSISTDAPITSTNVVFYVKGRCASGEHSTSDRSARIIVSCLIRET